MIFSIARFPFVFLESGANKMKISQWGNLCSWSKSNEQKQKKDYCGLLSSESPCAKAAVYIFSPSSEVSGLLRKIFVFKSFRFARIINKKIEIHSLEIRRIHRCKRKSFFFVVGWPNMNRSAELRAQWKLTGREIHSMNCNKNDIKGTLIELRVVYNFDCVQLCLMPEGNVRAGTKGFRWNRLFSQSLMRTLESFICSAFRLSQSKVLAEWKRNLNWKSFRKTLRLTRLQTSIL